MSNQEKSNQENATQQTGPFFVNFAADNAQFFLRRFRWVESEGSSESALAADCYVEYGKPRTKGQYSGKRQTSPCSIYFKGDTALARAEELIQHFGINELGKSVYISGSGSLGDLRAKVWFGSTDGKPDINKPNPYIAATLFRLDDVSFKHREKGSEWQEFVFQTQPPERDSTDESSLDEMPQVSQKPVASATNDNDEEHGELSSWLQDLIDQVTAGETSIAFAKDQEGFALANTVLSTRGYLFVDAANVFVKTQMTSDDKSPARHVA